MAVDGYLNFDTQVDTSGFNRGVKSVSNGLGTLETGFKKLAAVAAKTFSVYALVKFGKQALEVASDMQEVQNVVDTAFGEMSYKMEEFANTAIKQFGISRLAAKQTGSTFMAMARGMGISSDYASDMSVALTGLSADMASFYNVKQDVSSTALKSIFTGETETLKQFGVVMTEANLQAYALSQGITKSISAMTQQEKVQLRYNYVMQATALAQGDFARTATSWANQTRILSEQWKEFSNIIGNALMQVCLPVVNRLNDALSSLITYADSAYNALANFFGWKQVQSNAAGVTTEIASGVDAQNALTDAVNETAKAQENALAGFDKINKLADTSSGGNVADVSSGGSVSSPTTTTNVDVNTDPAESKMTQWLYTLRELLESAFEPIESAWTDYGAPFISSFKTGLSSLVGLAKSIGGSIAEVWTNGTGYETSSLILQIWTNINTAVGNAADSIKRAWDANNTGTSIVQGMADILNIVLQHWEGITSTSSDWWTEVDFSPLFTAFDGLLDAVAPFADNIGSGLEWFYTNVLLPLASWTIEDAIPTFLETLGEVIEGLTSVWETAAPVIKDELWDEFLQPIAKFTADVAIKALDKLGDVFKKICDSVTERQVRALIDLAKGVGMIIAVCKGYSMITAAATAITTLVSTKIIPWFTGIFTALGGAVTLTLGTVFAAIGALIAGWSLGSILYDLWGEEIDSFLWPIFDAVVAAWDAICTFITETVPTFFTTLWETIKTGVTAFCTSVGEFFSGLWDSITSTFKAIGKWFSAKFTAAWNGIKSAFSGAKTWFSNRWTDIKNVFSNVGSWFSEKFNTAWTNIKDVFSGIGQWFQNRWNDITRVFSGIGSWFSEKFTNAWGNIKKAFSIESIKTFFSEVWKGIKGCFSSIGTWFKDTFSDAWQKVKDVFCTGGEVFKGITDGIASTFKSVVNTLIDGLNEVIAIPFGAISDALDGIRDFKIGDLHPFTWLPTISIPEIPHLAQGTVVPANYGDFLAVLGDNKREPEIVSPQSTIEKAVENVMNRHGDGNINLTVNLDGKTVYKTVIKKNNESIRMTGKNPLSPTKGVTV